MALHDGPSNKLLNIGLWWMRSTNATRLLARRAENRTWGGWDQFVVNEELQFNREVAGASCCHTTCMRRAFVSQGELSRHSIA